MTTISLRTKTFQVPQSWNELTAKQLLQVINTVHSGVSTDFGHMMILKTLVNMPLVFWNALKWNEISDFLYIPKDLLQTRLTKQLLPVQQKWFHGPADEFNNLGMEEFIFTEDHFFKWVDTHNDHDLDLLCACLFRPAKKWHITREGIKERYDLQVNPAGDVRVPFNHFECSHNAMHHIRFWDPAKKLAILTWYEHNRLQLVDDFDNVFSGGGGEPAKYGLLTMMRNLAQAGTHGQWEKIEKLPLKLAMIELDEIKTEAEAIDRMQKPNVSTS